MKDLPKNKDDLLRKLQKIQNEYDAQKTSFKKSIASHTAIQERLTISETNYRRLFETAKDGILLLDAETGMITDVNPFLVELLDYSKDQFLEKAIWDIGFFKDIAANKDKFLELQQKKYVRYDDLPLETTDGRKIRVEFVSNVYPVNHHSVIQCNIRDITNRKKAEDAFRMNEEKYRTLFENVQDVFYQTDLNGIILDISPSIQHLSGFTRDEITGTNVSKLYNKPEDREILLNTLRQKGSVRDYELLLKTKTGEIKVVSLNSSIISDTNIKPNHIDGVFRDITQQKQSQESLKKSEYEFRMLAEAMPQIVWVTDTNGLNTYFNQQWVNYTGLTLEESHGDGWIKPFHPDEKQLAFDAWQNAVKNRGTYSLECRLRRADGVYKWWLIRGVPILDENGTIIKWFGTCTDIEELKNSEEELKNAKEHAEESDRLKSVFLANMSHEIRTPMNGILGFAGLLKNPTLTGEKQKAFIDIIEKSGARMLNIISDIIDISKIESGLSQLSISDTNVNEQIDSIFAFFKPEAEKKGLQLVVKANKPTQIHTDRPKLYAIISNLIKNAIKYTNKGSIEFGCEEKNNNLEFFVKDTGEGIPESHKEIIFNRFRQVNETDTRLYEGAGLGLSISKAYVEMLGGKIWVESELGKCTIFYFTLPLNIKEDIANPEEFKTIQNLPSVAKESCEFPEKEIKESHFENRINNQIEKLIILIAEDDEPAAFFLSQILESYCKEPIVVETGVAAVEACRKNPDIDLIMMDVRMPEMNGYDATRQIRQFNKDVVIIAQTAFGIGGEMEKARATSVGCNDYISKPINVSELNGLIQNHFNIGIL